MWSRVIRNLKCELYNYVSWNLPTSLVLSLLRFSSNVNTISATVMGISTASTPCSCRNFCHVLGLKIALTLLLRHFWTLNFSSVKQWKRNNIYKLRQTWNSKCSSYKYSTWHRTNVRTLLVCLQQKSSKVTWNYTWNLTLRRWILLGSTVSLQMKFYRHETTHHAVLSCMLWCWPDWLQLVQIVHVHNYIVVLSKIS